LVSGSSRRSSRCRSRHRFAPAEIARSFSENGAGNVKQLEGFNPPLFRIRIGAWRLIYRKQVDNAIEVVRVRNRKEAYR